MRKVVTILAAVMALTMLTATVAIAGGKSNKTGDTQPIIRVFDDGGDISGTVKLTKRDDGLTATAKVEGLIPGGVYTFWWIVGPAPVEAPVFFAALGGARVAGNSGKATVRMNAEVGQESIKNFVGTGDTTPFYPTLTAAALVTDEVHVEIAYHGQREDAGGDIGKWRSDFWTGTACPDHGPGDTLGSPHNPGGIPGIPGDVTNPGQPHCPVSYVAVFETS